MGILVIPGFSIWPLISVVINLGDRQDSIDLGIIFGSFIWSLGVKIASPSNSRISLLMSAFFVKDRKSIRAFFFFSPPFPIVIDLTISILEISLEDVTPPAPLIAYKRVVR